MNYYLRRIYKILANEEVFVRLRKMRSFQGQVNDDTLEIDPRREALSTVIHEALHYCYPKWSEAKTVKIEKAIANAMTERQWRNFIRRLGNKM